MSRTPEPACAWNNYRETIEQLYVAEDLSLPDVVLTMQKTHGFSATERQYRRRISAWDLDKNVKDDEMRAIITMENVRSQLGKKSIFFVRGRQVDKKKIDRFAQRKKIDRTAGLDAIQTRKLPGHVRCNTPPLEESAAPEPSNPPRKVKRKIGADDMTETTSRKRVQDLQARLDALAAAFQADSAQSSQRPDSLEHSQKDQALKELEHKVDALTAMILPQMQPDKRYHASTQSSHIQAEDSSPPVSTGFEVSIQSQQAHGSQRSSMSRGNDYEVSNKMPQVEAALDSCRKTNEQHPPWVNLYHYRFIHALRNLAQERLPQLRHPDLKTYIPGTPIRFYCGNCGKINTGMMYYCWICEDGDCELCHDCKIGDPPTDTRGHYLVKCDLHAWDVAVSLEDAWEHFNNVCGPSIAGIISAGVVEWLVSILEHGQHGHMLTYGLLNRAIVTNFMSLDMDRKYEMAQRGAVGPKHVRIPIDTLLQGGSSERAGSLAQGDDILDAGSEDTAVTSKTPLTNNATVSMAALSPTLDPYKLIMLLEATRREERAISVESLHSDQTSSQQSLDPHHAPHHKERERHIIVEPKDGQICGQTTCHQTSSASTPSHTSDIAEIDSATWEHSNLNQQRQHYEQLTRTGLEKLNKTMSDIFQDELYNPSTIPSVPPEPQPQSQRTPPGETLPQQKNSLIKELLQAAKDSHATAKSTPLALDPARKWSPFKPGSQLSPKRIPNHDHSAAVMRAQREAASGLHMLANHQRILSGFSAPGIISPKEVVLEYNETEKKDVTGKKDEGAAGYLQDDGSPDEDLPSIMGQVAPPHTSEQYSSYSRWSPTDSTHGLDKREYYASPIMTRLSSLPDALRDRPTDLFYFHFFLDNTARLLVSHDCEDNPFRKVLPRTAHRANLLNHPPPVMRIALWTKDVFQSLRQILTCVEPDKALSNHGLAIAIMLTSMKIVTPKVLETDTALSVYLTAANNMMKHNRLVPSTDASNDTGEGEEASFLNCWLQYLDAMGAVSHLEVDCASSAITAQGQPDEPRSKSVEVDCLSSCSAELMGILSKTAMAGKFQDQGGISSHASKDFQASQIVTSKLADAVLDSYLQRTCHKQRVPTGMVEKMEIQATQRLVSRANIVHRYRILEGRPTSHSSVQYHVQEILETLELVRPGRMESGILYPLFIAGCEAQTHVQKDVVLDRFHRLEKLGMA
ncbi:MAG: hypothetical protein Q9222_002753 [Ikaeria aurantiellina]